MKLASFNCTIELSRDENGYSNNYYIDVNDKGVNISQPYVTQTPEQVMFITNLVHDFIASVIAFNARVDGFNHDNHLEQYAPKASLTEEPTSESTDVSSVPQSCALGGGELSTEAEGKTKTLAQQVEDNVIESLGLK